MVDNSQSGTHNDFVAEKLQHMEIDDIWRKLGRFGKFQTKQTLFLLMMHLSMSWHSFYIVFIGYKPDYRCNTPENISDYWIHGTYENITTKYSKCHITRSVRNDTAPEEQISCEFGYNYSIPKERSIVSEWDLVCEKETLPGLSQSLFIFGQGLGSIAATLSDKFGRKPTYIISEALFFCVSVGTAFVENFWSFAVLRFATGALLMMAEIAGWNSIMEVIPDEHRSFIGALGGLWWALSSSTLTIVVYLLQNYTWRWTQIALAATTLHFAFAIFIMEESLRWLIVSRRAKAAVKLLKKACSLNRVCIDSIFQPRMSRGNTMAEFQENETNVDSAAKPKLAENEPAFSLLNNSSSDQRDVEDSSGEEKMQTKREQKREYEDKMIEMLRDKKLLKHSAIIWFAWFVDVLIYYGLFLTSSIMSSNRFLQYFLSCISELPATIFSWYSMYRFGRRFSCILGHVVAGLALLSSAVLSSFEDVAESVPALVTILVMLGKFGVTLSFNTLYTYTPELFPTTLRNTGMGIASLSGRVAGAVSPYSDNLAQFAKWLPGTIFASTSLLIAWMGKYLPETKGEELPQTIAELKQRTRNPIEKKKSQF